MILLFKKAIKNLYYLQEQEVYRVMSEYANKQCLWMTAVSLRFPCQIDMEI